MKKGDWASATKLSPSNFTKVKPPSQVASKKVLICLYISLNSGIVASKISEKLQGIS